MKKNNIVRVWIGHPYENGNFNGTAFFIDKNTLMTAKHVVINSHGSIYENIYLSDTPSGGVIPVDKVQLCKRDIAILKIKKNFNISNVLFTNNLDIGSSVEICGFHDKEGARNSKMHNISGYLNTTHTYELQNHLSAGLSGSPVFLYDRICGITQAINSQKNITYIIPIEESCSEHIITKLEKLKKIHAPIPNVSLRLESPTGIVPIGSYNYLEREDDEKCYQNLSERFSLTTIKAPMQYGKTSLLIRLMAKAKEEDYHIVFFEFQRFDKLFLTDLKELLEFMHDIIIDELGIEVKINKRLMDRFPPKARATRYMEKILLKIDKPLVLVIDEANKLFNNYEVSDNFFGLIRAWHEKAKQTPLWEKLKIILAYSIDPLLGIENLNQSPFHNVGLAVELKPFSKEELRNLSLRHNIDFEDSELEKFINFVGGHPFLSRKILYTIVKERQTLDEIIKNAYGKRSIFDEFKIYIRIFKDNEKLMKTIKKVLRGDSCDDYMSCYILESMGLIRYNLNRAEFSCELYREFFNRKL